MFGLMEPMAILNSPEVQLAIVPTVVLPFTILGVLISVIATNVAAFFGYRLRAEGPRRLLELLLKPRVIISALSLNLLIYAGYEAFQFYNNYPAFMSTVRSQNRMNPPSDRVYQNALLYTDKREPFAETRPVTKITQQWSKAVGSGVFGGITVSGDSLFVGNALGEVREIDKHTGKQLRRFFIGTPVTPQPTVYKNWLIVGEGEHATHHARVYAFNLQTGKLDRTFQTKGHIEGNMVIYHYEGRDYLFVSAGKDGFYALNPETFKVYWHVKVSHTDGEIRVSDGVAFFTDAMEKGYYQGILHAYAVDLKTGKKIWKQTIPTSGWNNAIFHRNDVCFFLGEVYYKTDYGQLACYRQKTGEPTVTINMDQSQLRRPEHIGDYAVAAGIMGKVCRIHLDHLTMKWCVQTKMKFKRFYSWPAVDRYGNVAIPTHTEGLVVYRWSDGRRLLNWTPQADDKPWFFHANNVLIDGDTWYTADYRGILRKFTVEYGAAESDEN